MKNVNYKGSKSIREKNATDYRIKVYQKMHFPGFAKKNSASHGCSGNIFGDFPNPWVFTVSRMGHGM